MKPMDLGIDVLTMEDISFCPICESKDVAKAGETPVYYRTDQGNIVTRPFPLYSCCDCRTLRLAIDNGTFKRHLDAANFTSAKNEDRLLRGREGFFRYLIDLLKSRQPASSRVLEFGTSYGHMARLGAAQGLEFAGVELVDEVRSLAQRNVPSASFFRTIDEVEGTDFDAAVSIDSLYYVESPSETLRQLAARLRRGGLLMLRVTNRVWYFNLTRALHGGRFSTSPIGDARWGFSRRGVETLLRKNGFSDAEFVYSEKGKRHQSIMRSMLYFWGGMVSDISGGLLPFSPGMIVLGRKV